MLFEAQREGLACSGRFLSETRTDVEEGDVVSLLRLLDQVGGVVVVPLLYYGTEGQVAACALVVLRKCVTSVYK